MSEISEAKSERLSCCARLENYCASEKNHDSVFYHLIFLLLLPFLYKMMRDIQKLACVEVECGDTP